MHREVTPFNPMIQVGKEGHPLEVSLDGSKSLGQGMNQPSLFWEEVRGMKTKGIPDANQPFWSAVGQS